MPSFFSWSKDELLKVYYLYKEWNGLDLSLDDSVIVSLSKEINKSPRSIYLKLAIFRNLDSQGVEQTQNVSKLDLRIWMEFELNRNTSFADQQNLPDINDLELEEDEEFHWNYDQWNEKLIQFIFDKMGEDPVRLFPISESLFRDVSDNLLDYHDFERAIRIDISGMGFEERFKKKLEQSTIDYNGKIRLIDPKYFAYIVFILHCLNRSQADEYNGNNVYDKINGYALENVGEKWGNPRTAFAKDLLEGAWDHLERWSNQKANVASFELRELKAQKKYVSKLTLHTLFSIEQLDTLLSVIGRYEIVQGEAISNEQWIKIIWENQGKIRKSKLLLEYLQEESEIREMLFRELNDYFLKNFRHDNYQTRRSGYTVACPVLMVVTLLRNGIKLGIDDISYKLFSEDFEYEVLCNGIELNHETGGYSESFKIDSQPTFTGASEKIKGNFARYTNKNTYRWLTQNSLFGAGKWIELLQPKYTDRFLVLGDSALKQIFEQEQIMGLKEFCTEWDDVYLFAFNNVDFEGFINIAKVTGKIYSPPSGKIELISKFNNVGRKEIFINFKTVFRYGGAQSQPELIATSEDKTVSLIPFKEDSTQFTLPEDFPLNWEFKLREVNSGVISHLNYTAVDLRYFAPINVEKPYSKDEDGHNLIQRKPLENDYFDIPNLYLRGINYDKWAQNRFKVFRSGKKGAVVKPTSYQEYSQDHLGELLLKYLAIRPTKTADFIELIRELDPKISIPHGRKILYFWRDLGYIHFAELGQNIKVVPTSLFFVSTSVGLKGYLTGFRSLELIEQLKERCKYYNLNIEFKSHFKENPKEEFDFESIKAKQQSKGIYPYRVFISDPLDDLDKYLMLKKDLNIYYLNNVKHAFHDDHTPYPLACLTMQRSVMNEFDDYIKFRKDSIINDTAVKDVFNYKKYEVWEESYLTKFELQKPVLIRFKGFEDKRMPMAYVDEYYEKSIFDYGTVAFHLINKDVLYRQPDPQYDKEFSDLYVPLNLKLPFWIERGLILMNAMVPEILKIEIQEKNETGEILAKSLIVRKYRNISDEIVAYIGKKLNQNIKVIKE